MPVFIASTGNHAGQSLLGWAIAQRLRTKGLNVGFFKPFGTHPISIERLSTDRDALLFKEILNLEEPLEQICPYNFSDTQWRQKRPEEISQELTSILSKISRKKDILLIMGSKEIFFDDASNPFPDSSLITKLDCDLLLINRYQEISKSIYSILSVCSFFRERTKGIIINRIPSEKLKGISEQLDPFLQQKGIPFTTFLTEDPIISSRSLQEVLQILDGELLLGKEGLIQPICGMTVGSTHLEGRLLLFKRVYNKIVLLGPATMTEEPVIHRPISGIILTGGRRPVPQLIEAARKANIPLILVKSDTFTTLDRLERTGPTLSPKDEWKVRRLTELMDQEGALEKILNSLGIQKY